MLEVGDAEVWKTLSNKRKSLIEVSGRTDFSALIVELGSYYFDDTMLIGKIVDFNMWDRSGRSTSYF